jgi:hypothetical protein
MGLWRFMDYCSPAGNDLIEEWYEEIGEEAQAEFDVTLKVLIHSQGLAWNVGVQAPR